MQNSLAVVALAEKGNLLNAPDVYMDKIAVGPGLPGGVVDLDNSVEENVKAVAKAKDRPISDMLVCVLDRPRHTSIIEQIRATGARVKLIGDGDVAGVIDTTDPDTSVDLYMGSGGAPEGVLAAAALRCIGGQIQGRLTFRNDDERARAHKWGIEDLDRKYSTEDMAAGDVIFAATGVTDGTLLRGVHITPDGKGYTTDTVVMRSASKTVRNIKTVHNREIKLS
jgi:fructose-1,6-bisphosphatase II / sedoheptulose-1,7-bisphosphatase